MAANRQQLEQALINAHKAGDTKAAEMLANALKQPVQQPERRITSPLDSALGVASNQLQNVGEGALMGFRDELEAGVSGLFDDRPYTVRLADIEQRRARDNANNPYEIPAKLSGGLFTGALTGKMFNPSTVLGTGTLAGTEGLIAGAGLSENTLQGDPVGLAEDALIGGGIGLAGGATFGVVGNLAYRSMSPMAKRVLAWVKGSGEKARVTTHQRNLQTAKEFDIPTTAPERLADDALMMKQARYESDPDLAKSVTPILEGRANRINQIARQEIGLPPADDINRVDLGIAAKNIRNKFKSVESQYQPVKLDDDMVTNLDNIVSTKAIVKPPEKAITAIERTKELLDEGMTGGQYLQQRSNIDKEIQAIYKQANPDVRLAETYAEIIEVLDDKFASQLSGGAADTLKEARYQWKNLRLLDRPNAVQGGDVRLGSVKTGLNRNKGFLRGLDQSPLAKLADFADSTKFNFGRSGTAERSPNLYQDVKAMLEMPFANATISRGGMIPLRGSVEANIAGGGAGVASVPALEIGAKDARGLLE